MGQKQWFWQVTALATKAPEALSEGPRAPTVEREPVSTSCSLTSLLPWCEYVHTHTYVGMPNKVKMTESDMAAREMAQQLRVLTAPTEDPSLGPSTRIPSSQLPIAPASPRGVTFHGSPPSWHTYTHSYESSKCKHTQ